MITPGMIDPMPGARLEHTHKTTRATCENPYTAQPDKQSHHSNDRPHISRNKLRQQNDNSRAYYQTKEKTKKRRKGKKVKMEKRKRKEKGRKTLKEAIPGVV